MIKLFALLRFPWSRWVDIMTFTYLSDGYLLQGRVNRITGRKQFAARAMKQGWRIFLDTPTPTNEQVASIEP